jgi:hypothetical protein
LNASYRIEKECGQKLPFRDWLAIEYGPVEAACSPFRVSQILAFLVRPTAAAEAGRQDS